MKHSVYGHETSIHEKTKFGTVFAISCEKGQSKNL